MAPVLFVAARTAKPARAHAFDDPAAVGAELEHVSAHNPPPSAPEGENKKDDKRDDPFHRQPLSRSPNSSAFFLTPAARPPLE